MICARYLQLLKFHIIANKKETCSQHKHSRNSIARQIKITGCETIASV